MTPRDLAPEDAELIAAFIDRRLPEEEREAFVERLTPGRWPEVRAVTDQELKATTVLSMELNEVSAKVRTGIWCLSSGPGRVVEMPPGCSP